MHLKSKDGRGQSLLLFGDSPRRAGGTVPAERESTFLEVMIEINEIRK